MQSVKKISHEGSSKSNYSKFDKINGAHPLKNIIPEGYVEYSARIRPGGKLRYFNFSLARQMGLINKDHENIINSKLEEKILNTFGIIIINEYDQLNGKTFDASQLKPGKYMATRYLQLQHDNKTGKNSGDGRSIWNGQVKNKGRTWDISSCGTGATRLSPATSKYNRFFESGDPTISYGCGYAEIDEGIVQALFSEVFYQNNVPTERVLAVIEYEKGYSINVRAHENLLRPSHLFLHLKQSNYKALKALVDYYIESQARYKEWEGCPKGNKKYDFLLNHLSSTFAQMAATFESEYIFCWLDWDGDNILMNGGIIDYGSVRQFGLFHSEYRYDDVERFSTSILEQRDKARYIVQTFAQMIDYVKTGQKKPLGTFKKDLSLKKFDQEFEDNKDFDLLIKIGFSHKDANYLFQNYRSKIKEFRKVYSYFERAKSKTGKIKVSDGISWDAIFCMRDILRELPQMLIARKQKINPEEFLDIIKSNYATPVDLELTPYRVKMINAFQDLYILLINKSLSHSSNKYEKQILEVSMRSSVINKMEKVTGDSISVIVDKILKKKSKLSVEQIYNLIKDFSEVQNVDPNYIPNLNKSTKSMVKQFFEIVKEYREGL